MKHLQPILLFLNERKDIETVERVEEIANRFIETLKRRVNTKYEEACAGYNLKNKARSNVYYSVLAGSLTMSGVGLPDLRVKLATTKELDATGRFAPEDGIIFLHAPELCEKLRLFIHYATATVGLEDRDDRASYMREAEFYRDAIVGYNFTSLLSILHHEITHYLDYKEHGNHIDYHWNKADKKRDDHLSKMGNRPEGQDINAYMRTKQFKDFDSHLYYNSNHEYNAYFMGYATDVTRDVRNGKPLPATFQAFQVMSEKDYPELRLNKMNGKVRRAMLKRMFDLYTHLIKGTEDI